jgi:hypothetical protein
MTFEEYLIKKKIDSTSFKLAEPAQWQEWSVLFESMSEASFTAQKLYLINPTRRKYLLKEELIEKPKSAPVATKPVMRPKMN